jgi:hypothetical protein
MEHAKIEKVYVCMYVSDDANKGLRLDVDRRTLTEIKSPSIQF